MAELTYLRDIVLILAAALIVVTLLHRLRIPPIAGFIFAGALIGPEALSLIDDVHQVEILAEIGVALLLFGIGLELSLERVRQLWVPIIIGGALQVGLTILASFGIATWFGLAWNTSLFIGFIIAVSSTAIVLRGLEDRGELDAPHGRFALGVLVFQDLCVVPMMLVIPLISGEGASASTVAFTLLRALAVIIGVVVGARFIFPYIFKFIAKTRQRQLFITAVLLICIGTAWLTSKAGVSLALGAFLAGLVVADSEYRHQALGDLIPFKEVFTSLFFISVGMLLSPANVLAQLDVVLLLLVAILIGKALLVFVAAQFMRLPLRVAVLAAVGLAQVGEFSFVLVKASADSGLLAASLESNILAAAILSMLITPFALMLGPKIAAGVGRMQWLSSTLKIRTAEDLKETVDRLENHVIIGGYGFVGRELANALKARKVPYIVTDLNVNNVKKAIDEGQPACFGDITSHEVLERLGASHARELVIVINDPNAVERAIREARRAAPNLHIVARSRYILDIEPLLKAGANEVVPAEVEAGAEVTARVLRRHNVPEEQVSRHVKAIRGVKEEE